MTSSKILGWLSVLTLPVQFLNAAGAPAVEPHGRSIQSATFAAEIKDGWLTRWINKRTGETFEFGRPENEAALSAVYQPGFWAIPGYKQENKTSQWKLEAESPEADTLQIVQQLEVDDGLAQSVQWSLRLPLDKIDASYWPTGLTSSVLSKDSVDAGRAIGPSYYFGNRNAVISSHTWRQRFYIIQGQKSGLLIYVDDPEMDHFSVVEMDKKNFPRDVVLTHRSMASPPWATRYTGNKWKIVQYDGWVNQATSLFQKHLIKAYDLKPISGRPTAWVNNVDWSFVRAPFTSPILNFPKSSDPNYTENWEQNLKLVDQWLENVSKVLDPDKVMFYVNWWRYAAHDTMFPEHSVDPFFAMAVGKVRKMGYHVMLHFHSHLAQDATTFYGRYVAKQDEWHRAAYPNRPKAIGDPEGKLAWGVGYDFVRRTDVVQADKEFGTKASARLGLPIRMTGYHMSPGYEGWRYMKVAEILSAIRATGADAIHLDVPSVWPEGKERYGINSQQGLREFYKLLRETLDNNGLANVAIATEQTPGEGYMRYVDMAQLVRGYSVLNALNGLMVETLIELQLGNDFEQANKVRASAKARYASEDDKKIQQQLRFDKEAVGAQLTKMREFGEPNVDAMVIDPYIRAYPHLGSATPLMGGYPGDPNASVHNRAAQALHTWATLRRGASFNCSPSIQMFMDTAPWDSLDVIKGARKENIKRGIRSEGKIFNDYSYNELALARYWEKYQPRFAPTVEWQKGDVARFKLNTGSTLTVRRTEPLTMNLSVDGKTLAEIGIFDGWKKNEALLKDFGPTFLLNQIDSKK